MADRPLPPEIQAAYENLKKVRVSKTVALKPTPMLRTEIIGLDGKPQPLRLRYYQSQGIYHLLMMKRMVLGDGTGLGKCQTSDTPVLSSEGWVPLGSFKPASLNTSTAQEGFYELDRETFVWTGHRMARVSRFYWSGRKPTIRLTTKDGHVLEGSLVHPLWCRRPEGETWVPMADIKVGDYLCVDRSEAPFPTEDPEILFDATDHHPNARSYTFPQRLNPDLAALLGYVVAEGNRSPSGVDVTQDSVLNPDVHAEIRDLFRRVFGWEGNEHRKDKDVRICVSSKEILRFLLACGYTEVLSADKSTPWSVMRATRESVRAFLSAIIEAEGSVEKGGGLEFCSASKQLAQEVQLMLLRFGVVAALRPKHIKGRTHTYWRLTWSGEAARTFQREIGFRSERKRNRLTSALDIPSNPNKDVVPHAINAVQSLKDSMLFATSKKGANGLRKGSGFKQFGESFQSTLKHILKGSRNPTYQWLVKFLAAAKQVGLEGTPEYLAVTEIVCRHFFYDPVVKIEHGSAEVMDIEVDDPDHSYVANGLLSHNTCQVIGALCYLWPKEPANKVIVVCPKSALRQWEGEIHRFAKNIKTYVVTTSTLKERRKVYEAWANHPTNTDEKAVLLVNYHLLIRDWTEGAGRVNPKDPKSPVKPGMVHEIVQNTQNTVVVFDEATAFKTNSTKTWQVCSQLSGLAHRAYGLTATLLKNNLLEGFSIYKALVPDLFATKTSFMNDYCVTRLTKVGGGRSVPLVVGYRNLQHFRDKIDPFFLGRPKHVVSDELPTLITKEILCELSPAEDAKYGEALSGIFELGDGTVKDYEEHKAFVSLIYCQQVVDSLALLKFEAGSEIETGVYRDEYLKIDKLGAKEQALLDLITDELENDKVIIYTRFEKVVTRLQQVLADAKVKSVRITGHEDDKTRRKNQEVFQNLESDTKVIFITDAGSEAINLQAASAMIFYDAPWSWGNYVQLLGRPIRIGSPHQHIVCYHLVAERPREKKKDRKTIDHHVLSLLQSKKNLIDRVLGEAAVGALTFEKEGSGTKELMRRLQGKESADE